MPASSEALPRAATPPRPLGTQGSHRKPPPRRTRGERLAAALIVVVGFVTIGLASGFGAESSAEPTVKSFLLAWAQQQYSTAARLTSGARPAVAAQLQAAFTDLDATQMLLSMGPIVQHGRSAVASFTVTMNIAGGGHQWTYQGRLVLDEKGGNWVVEWHPSVINPALGPGDRLAVRTSFGRRAPVLDLEGQPLLARTTVYSIGVTPGQLAHPQRTADLLGQVTQLNGQQMLGQIIAAPPRQFMPLLTLSPAAYAKLAPRLRKIPGIQAQRTRERLFEPLFDAPVGSVGTENSPTLLAQGELYQPGATLGLSGIEQAFQHTLAGTASTQVVVVGSNGRTLSTLANWPGTPATPVRTTIQAPVQQAASAVLRARPGSSGEIIAVNTENGDIVAAAEHDVDGQPLPPGGVFNARVAPGMAFTIVSTAALLNSGGVTVDKVVPCEPVENVGGETFTNGSAGNSAGQPFSSVFAEGCSVEFANLSLLLNSADLDSAARSFGVGYNWHLPVQAFSGSQATGRAGAALAAEMIGQSGVRMSPLAMALVAAEVASGAGHAPALVASDPPASWSWSLSQNSLADLRVLMRKAVRAGAARAANVPGQQVFGQCGVVETSPGHWTSWFVGYRGSLAFTVLQTGSSSRQAAAALASAFLKGIR